MAERSCLEGGWLLYRRSLRRPLFKAIKFFRGCFSPAALTESIGLGISKSGPMNLVCTSALSGKGHEQ